MANVIVTSLNVHGLGSNTKRTTILDYLWHRHVDITFLQEAWFLVNNLLRLGNNVASNQNFGFSSDELGMFCYLLLQFGARKLTLCSSYAPMPYQHSFFSSLSNQFLNFKSYEFILVKSTSSYPIYTSLSSGNTTPLLLMHL
uniref:Uncharacterized protein n=1 Tax=Erpetoichthys calabaricus TaxID=27687 RepID=A0A8C4RRJ0_ERPCA